MLGKTYGKMVLMTYEDERLGRTSTNPTRADMVESKRILIIDPDPVVRHFLRRMMHMQGYDCVDVADAGGAITQRKLRQPSLIIADGHMSDVDRTQFLQDLANQSPSQSVPVILLTSTEDSVPSDCGKDLGVCAILKKPLDYRQISSVVSSVIAD